MERKELIPTSDKEIHEDVEHYGSMCDIMFYSKKDADAVMDSLEDKIAKLDDAFESCKANLESEKATNEELNERIKELEKELENVQYSMATENTDLGMENLKLKERINVLEKQAEVTDRMLQDMAKNNNREFLPDANEHADKINPK